MTILVTGSTGTVGRQVVQQLVQAKAKVRALTRSDKPEGFPEGVQIAKGDFSDLDSLRAALQGVDTVFVLNAVVPDELTQALLAIDLAAEAKVKGLVYLSVFGGALYKEVPHFTAKHTVEQALDDADLPATVLRPAYFMQNDVGQKQALASGVYGMPIGSVGLNMVDVRDIAEVAARELLRREAAKGPLPRATVSLVGPDRLTGADVARIWSETLEKPIHYAGDDVVAFEATLRKFVPAWSARDMRLMAKGFQRHGMVASASAIQTLETLLERKLRSYRDFAAETVAQWRRS